MERHLLRPRSEQALPSLRRVLARAGCGPEPDGRMLAAAQQALDRLVTLARPVYAGVELSVQEFSEHGLILETGARLFSGDLSRKMARAVRISLLAASVGPGPEEECVRLESAGEATRSLFLDAAASEMTEQLLRMAHADAAKRMAGFAGTARYAPGYGDFSLENQALILEALGAEELGIRMVEGSWMMEPRKSTTGVVGWLSRTD